jgi:hypothetical protein
VPLALSSLSWSVKYDSGLLRVAVVMSASKLPCQGFRGMNQGYRTSLIRNFVILSAFFARRTDAVFLAAATMHGFFAWLRTTIHKSIFPPPDPQPDPQPDQPVRT